MIGDRVRHARLYHGWTQQALADMVGVTQSAIRQIELTGNVSEATLGKIANVTDFSRWWFDLGPLPDLPEGTLRFRKRASATKRDEERLRAYARQTIEAITRHLEQSKAELPPVRIRPLTSQATALAPEAIEDAAAEVRIWLGVGPDDPIRNLINAAERSGIVIVGIAHELERHDAVSFSAGYPISRPYIFFSRGHCGDRQRYSIAHEIGHLMLHSYRNVDPKTAEKEADVFAADLLLPRAAALEDIGGEFVTLRSLAHVKVRWGISIRALIRRALDVNLIDTQRRISLEKQYSARGWHRGEPVLVPEERPALVRSLMVASVGDASPIRLRPALGLPAMAARELVA